MADLQQLLIEQVLMLQLNCAESLINGPILLFFDITSYRLKKFTFIRSRKLTDIVDNSVMPV